MVNEKASARKRATPVAKRKTPLKKANSEALAVTRLRLGEVGTSALKRIQDDAESMKVHETRWPGCIRTFEAMRNDATIATALTLKVMYVEQAFNEWHIDYNKESAASKEAADFLRYNLNNLDKQTVRTIASTVTDNMNVFGFSLAYKVYSKITSGAYAGKYPFRLKSLSNRPPQSLDYVLPFEYASDGNSILGFWQDPNSFSMGFGYNLFESTDAAVEAMKQSRVFLEYPKCALFSLNATEANPMGRSPLIACYKPYREKVIIENLEVVGATKGLAGILELKIPSSILQKAAVDPTGREAVFLKQLMIDAGNAHKGEQSFFILPSDVQVGNQPQYSMTLKGIEGTAGKTETSSLINERKKLILDIFGAGFINLGNEAHGSYALSEGKQSLHAYFVERDIITIEEVFNTDIIPQLLALNDIRLSDEDMPKLRAGSIDKPDFAVFSAGMQRLKAVGLVPVTVEVVNEVLEMSGLQYRVPSNTTPEELNKLLGNMLTEQSRSGDSFNTSTGGLNGTSDKVSTTDNSVSNKNNITS